MLHHTRISTGCDDVTMLQLFSFHTPPKTYTCHKVLKNLPAAEHPSVLQASQHQETHPELVGSLLFSKRRD